MKRHAFGSGMLLVVVVGGCCCCFSLDWLGIVFVAVRAAAVSLVFEGIFAVLSSRFMLFLRCCYHREESVNSAFATPFAVTTNILGGEADRQFQSFTPGGLVYTSRTDLERPCTWRSRGVGGTAPKGPHRCHNFRPRRSAPKQAARLQSGRSVGRSGRSVGYY
eukprot:COSAG05_NODE_227_length_13407_cov_32.277953_13_plen_163_part_00